MYARRPEWPWDQATSGGFPASADRALAGWITRDDCALVRVDTRSAATLPPIRNQPTSWPFAWPSGIRFHTRPSFIIVFRCMASAPWVVARTLVVTPRAVDRQHKHLREN